MEDVIKGCNIKTVKIKEPQFIYCKHIFIIDDATSFLRDANIKKSLIRLWTTNRHIKSCIIWSVHYLKKLDPCIRANSDIIILFGWIGKLKLMEIYDDSNIHVSFDKFLEIYNFATNDPYNFLYINLNTLEFRKNFNEQIFIT